MSAYENYSRTAAAYDRTRSAVGHEIWLGHLAAMGRAMTGLRVLDAGCGTANYTLALAPRVARVTALDLNPAMLGAAARKLDRVGLAAKVDLVRGSMTDLPLADQSHDAVLFNHVLHHLGRADGGGFAGCGRAIAEAARVLRPGGRVFINACSRTQMAHGFWYCGLAPAALEKIQALMVPSGELRAILATAGLDVDTTISILSPTMMAEAYDDGRGPLDPSWRDGDSFWALVGDQELRRVEARITEMDRAGTLDDYVAEHDRARRHVGQATFWVARKPVVGS